jgi:hypothetical protein
MHGSTPGEGDVGYSSGPCLNHRLLSLRRYLADGPYVPREMSANEKKSEAGPKGFKQKRAHRADDPGQEEEGGDEGDDADDIEE